MNFKSYISDKINRSDERSTNAIKNIMASFGIKGVSVLVSFLLVPMTIHYVNSTQYGLWLTLSSIIGWFSLFDIGFGNGLRNRFAEAKATGDYDKAKAYVSTTYICLGVIFTIVWILFFCVNFFIDWSKILNAPEQMAKELSVVALIVISFFCLQMVLQLITTILAANQKTAKSDFINMVGQLCVLTVVFILTKTTQGSLIYLALALGFCPILVTLFASFWFYRHEYKGYRPVVHLFDINLAKDIFILGSKFFFIQIAVIILYQSANIIIIQVGNPENVTSYNIANRYFGIITMVFTIILAPLWSAYTEAYKKGEYAWIKNTLKKMIAIWGIFVAVAFIMLLFSSCFYQLWVGKQTADSIPSSLSLACAIYISISTWNNILAYLLNGIGKIKMMLLLSIIQIFTFIPLSLLLGKNYGMVGIVYALCIVSFLPAVIQPVQYYKILNHKASGIWNS